LDLLDRRECPDRVAELQVRGVVRTVMRERTDVLIPDGGIGDLVDFLEYCGCIVPSVGSLAVHRNQRRAFRLVSRVGPA